MARVHQQLWNKILSLFIVLFNETSQTSQIGLTCKLPHSKIKTGLQIFKAIAMIFIFYKN